LSGKHTREAPEEGSRFTLGSAGPRYQDRYWHEGMFETVEQLRPLAAEAGMPLATMALSWVLANPVITSPIIGASRPEQLDDLLLAMEKPLPAELKLQLDELTAGYRRGDSAR
jgi:aryl-alcohol dehydrogenase (NADP+)